MRKILVLCLLLCLLMPSAVSGEDEDWSMFDDLDGEIILDDVEEEEAAASIYEDDGSVLLTMTFTGDFTIGKNAKSRTDIFDRELNEQGGDPGFCMQNVRDILAADDLTVINFEGTLTTSTVIPKAKQGNSFLFSAPPSYVSILTENSIECASLENNHTMDFGEEGFADTRRTLEEAGVVASTTEQWGVINIKGVDVCILSYLCIDRYDKPVGGYATLYEKVAADIGSAKAQYPIVIVCFHWGVEKDYAPTSNQIRMGRAAVDAGADLVIGNHSHRIQPIECYNGVYICYSLGNFCFAGNHKPDDMTSILFQTRFRVKDGTVTNEGFRIIPIRISSRKDYNNFIPTPLTDVTNQDGVVTTLKTNGRKLTYAVEDYPLDWE